MRNLFLLLVLANLGVFAAYNWVLDQSVARAPYDGPGIMLMREAEPEPAIANQDASVPNSSGDSALLSPEPIVGEAGDSVAPPPVAGVPEAGPRCVSIGPFTEETAADDARAALAEAGFDPRPATREAEVWDGYWVYLGRIDSMQEAREIAADLGSGGIDDTQIMPNTDSGIVLSLGVFSEISRAGTQAERASRIGYQATIADSMRTTETQWLDVSLSGEDSPLLDLLQVPGTISRLEQVACVAAGDE